MADKAPVTMSENARQAASLIAKEQQLRPGKKVRVVAIKDGFDGFKVRHEGERFVAWWPDDAKHPYDPADPKLAAWYRIPAADRDKAVADGREPRRLSGPSWQMEEKAYDKMQKGAAKEEEESADIGD